MTARSVTPNAIATTHWVHVTTLSEIFGVARCRVVRKVATPAQLPEQPPRNKQWPSSSEQILSVTDAHKDVELVKSIYSALIEAKKMCGESVEDFSFPRFHRLIASQADGLKERLGCDRVCIYD